MNPKGNHPIFPLLPNGKRDVDHSWKLSDTWKQMEAVLKKGDYLLKVDLLPRDFCDNVFDRQSQIHRGIEFLPSQT